MASLALVTRSTAEMQTRKRRGCPQTRGRGQAAGRGPGAPEGGPGGWGRACRQGGAAVTRVPREPPGTDGTEHLPREIPNFLFRLRFL